MLRPPCSSVAVRDRGYGKGVPTDGPVERAELRRRRSPDFGGKVVALGCAWTSAVCLPEPEDHKWLHSWDLNAADGDPVRPSTGRLVAGSEERNRDTFPTRRFVRRPSTRNSLFPAEGGYPQNYMVDQQKLQISELLFEKFRTPSSFSHLRLDHTSKECLRLLRPLLKILLSAREVLRTTKAFHVDETRSILPNLSCREIVDSSH